jgi:hypothetical protein
MNKKGGWILTLVLIWIMLSAMIIMTASIWGEEVRCYWWGCIYKDVDLGYRIEIKTNQTYDNITGKVNYTYLCSVDEGPWVPCKDLLKNETYEIIRKWELVRGNESTLE